MKRPARRAALLGTLALWAGALVPGAVVVAPAVAQSAGGGGAAGDADVRRMIDALRAASAPVGRTRTLIVVPNNDPAPPTATAATPPVAPSPPAQPAAAPPAAPAAVAAPPAPATTPAPAATPTPPRPAPTAPTAPAAPAAPAAASEPASLSLPIPFEPNSAQLRPESGPMLGALMAAMLSPELRSARFVIEGHTEAGGQAAQSLRLSRDRAEQVRVYLVTLGVQAERLQAVGKGFTSLANPRDPRSLENRRVRIVAMP